MTNIIRHNPKYKYIIFILLIVVFLSAFFAINEAYSAPSPHKYTASNMYFGYWEQDGNYYYTAVGGQTIPLGANLYQDIRYQMATYNVYTGHEITDYDNYRYWYGDKSKLDRAPNPRILENYVASLEVHSGIIGSTTSIAPNVTIRPSGNDDSSSGRTQKEYFSLVYTSTDKLYMEDPVAWGIANGTITPYINASLSIDAWPEPLEWNYLDWENRRSKNLTVEFDGHLSLIYYLFPHLQNKKANETATFFA